MAAFASIRKALSPLKGIQVSLRLHQNMAHSTPLHLVLYYPVPCSDEVLSEALESSRSRPYMLHEWRRRVGRLPTTRAWPYRWSTLWAFSMGCVSLPLSPFSGGWSQGFFLAGQPASPSSHAGLERSSG